MGSGFDSWTGITGAYYPGALAETHWESTWVLIAIGLCVVALLTGLVHELRAYRRAARIYPQLVAMDEAEQTGNY